MKVRIVKNDESDSAIARNISNMTLANYMKGLAIANHEVEEESGISDSVGIVDPTETVRMGKQKSVSVGGPGVSKGYKIKGINASEQTKTDVTAGSPMAKDFIIQSRALDNELDHVVAHMKLNNKDEFYDGPSNTGLAPAVLKASVKNNPQIKKLEHSILNRSIVLQQMKKEYTKHLAKGNDQEDEIEEQIEEMEDEIGDLSSQLRKMKEQYDPIDTFKEQGKTIDSLRNEGKGNQHLFTQMKQAEYESTMSGANSHLKSKNGIRVVNATDVEKFSQDLLLAIKKIVSHITSVLMPLAQKMYDKRFQGITLQDKNYTIPELYKDMDDKMYILTSLNNQSNTQLIKLDKEFDKLYDMVKNGLSMYVMPTGGSMVKSYAGGHIRTRTNYQYEL